MPDSVRDVVSAPGKPVDAALRKPVESEIGQSLKHARVHRSPAADAACDQLNARAFTVNNHVAVRSDQPSPDTPAGQHLMSHELTHVAQQTGGAVSLLPDAGTLKVDPSRRLEEEAEETAKRVMQGGDVGIQRLSDTDVHVQRSIDMGDARVSESRARQINEQSDEVKKRKQRLEGYDPDTQTEIRPAIKQVGGSCAFAVEQALLTLLGRDTSAMVEIIANMPDYEDLDQYQEDALDENKTSINEFIEEVFPEDDIFDKKIRTYLRTVLNVADKDGLARRHDWGAQRRDPGRDVFTQTYAKRLLYSLGIFHGRTLTLGGEYAKTRGKHFDVGVNSTSLAIQKDVTSGSIDEISKKNPMYETLRIGQNLLKYSLQAGNPGFHPSKEEKTLGPIDDMNTLKEGFIQILDTLGTPVIVGSDTFYEEVSLIPDPFLTRGVPHVIVVYGLTVDDDGNAFVEFKDGNDDKPNRIALNKFLSPYCKDFVHNFNKVDHMADNKGPIKGEATTMFIKDTKNIHNEYLNNLSRRQATQMQGGQQSALQGPTGTTGQQPDPPGWDLNVLTQPLLDEAAEAAEAEKSLLEEWRKAIENWNNEQGAQNNSGGSIEPSERLAAMMFEGDFKRYPRIISINNEDILNDLKLIRPGNNISYQYYIDKLQQHTTESRIRNERISSQFEQLKPEYINKAIAMLNKNR